MVIALLPRRLLLASAMALLVGDPTGTPHLSGTPQQESWSLAAGSVFEILATHPRADVEFSWSLTKADGSFLQADRGPLFRERFVESGDYTLRTEVMTPDRSPITQRTFILHVTPPSAEPSAPPMGVSVTTGTPFFGTDITPAADGTIALGENRQTLLLTPFATGMARFAIDLDNTRDTNRDGDPTDDADTQGTFFESDGTPLRLWFADPMTDRSITVRSDSTNGMSTAVLHVSASAVATTTPPPLPGTTDDLGLIRAENRGGGTFAFSLDTTTIATEGRAILFLWDFGDGKQSLLDRPMHAYTSTGTYTIGVRARDLATTQEILTLNGTLSVTLNEPAGAGTSSSASVAPSASSVSSAPSTSGSSFLAKLWGGSIGLIIKILLVVVLSIAAGFFLTSAIAKVVRRKLHEAETPTGSPQQSQTPSAPPPLDHPAPMEVIDVAPERESKPSPPKKTHGPPIEPKLTDLTFQEETAPDWLKQAHDIAEKKGHTVESAPPSALQEEEAAEPPTAPPPDQQAPAEMLEPPPAEKPTSPQPAPEQPVVPPWLAESVPPEPEPTPPPPPPPAATPPTPPPTPQEPPPPPPPPKTEPQPKAPTPPPKVPIISPALQPTAMPSPTPEPQSTPTHPPPAQKEELTPEERERRRKKRQRYRANKKKREEEGEKAKETKETEEAKETKEQPVISVKPSASAVPTLTPPPTTTPPKKSTPSPQPMAPVKEPPKEPEPPDEQIAIIRAEDLSTDQKK